MRTVWKFPLRIGKITTIDVPSTAQVVLAALDPADGGPAIWLELDTEDKQRPRRFWIHGTGHPIEPDHRHVGSMIDRSFVWHVYEIVG